MEQSRMELDEMIVTEEEYSIIKVLSAGLMTPKEISRMTGLGYQRVMFILKDFCELNVLRCVKNEYEVSKGMRFRVIDKIRSNAAQEKRVPVEPTYKRDLGQKRQPPELKITYWTPEQIAEHEKRITKGKYIEPPKKGANWSESGHHFFRSG